MNVGELKEKLDNFPDEMHVGIDFDGAGTMNVAVEGGAWPHEEVVWITEESGAENAGEEGEE